MEKIKLDEVKVGNIISDIRLGGEMDPIIFKAVKKIDNTLYLISVTDEERNPYSALEGEYMFDTNGPGHFWLISENRG